MVIFIAGCSHTGKTALAQKLLEKYRFPYLSADHLKMGLIRSGYTDLKPEDDQELMSYLWPIIREIVKTVIENRQNLVVEGCYIPFGWKNDFSDFYLKQIRYYCLIMTEDYIQKKICDIRKYANIIEHRLDSSLNAEAMIRENAENLRRCKSYGYSYILIDKDYPADIDLDIQLQKKSCISEIGVIRKGDTE